jgi:trimeric autotransporter adhesin
MTKPQINMKIVSFLLLLVVFLPKMNAATITSTTGGGNWSAGTTWVGGNIPSSNDEVVINGSVIINSSKACVKLTINSSKSLSFATGGYVLTITNNWQTAFVNNGTFNAGDGTVKFVASNAGFTVSGNVTFNNVILQNIKQMNMGGNATVNGRLILDNADFGYNNNNHPVYGPNAILEVNGTYSPSTNPLIWATDNSSKTAPNIVIASGSITSNQGQLYLKKTFTVNIGATFNGSAGCTHMVSGFQSITNNGTISLGGVTVKAGATWNVTSNFSLATLKIESGGTVNANSYTLTIDNGSINNCGGINGIMQLEPGGTFNAGTSTIVFNPAFNSNVTADVSGPINFNNVVASGSAPIVIPTTSTVTVSGNVTVNSGSTINNPGNITFDSTATVTNNGSSSGTGFPPTVETTPPSNNNLTGTISGSKAGAAAIQSSVTVTLSGNVDINSGTSKTLTVAPGAELTMGTYTISADTIFIYGKLSLSNTTGLSGAFLKNNGTPVIILGSGSTITYNSTIAQTITPRNDYVHLKLTGNGSKIFAAGTYSIAGDFTVEGGSANITTNTTTFNFNGNMAQSIKGLPYKNVSFSGSGNKTLTDSTAVTGVLGLAGSANLISNGLVTLVSNASGTASIGQILGTATITGNINYQRYIPAGRLWRFIGWPISGSTFSNSWQNDMYLTGAGTGGSIGTTNSNGFDYTASGEPGLYYYNETSTASLNAKWATIPNTTTAIDPTRGYRLFIRGNRSQGTTQLTGTSYTPLPVTLKGSGLPNKGDIAVSLTCSNGCTANDGWHLLANPYPSAIDWSNSAWAATRNANIVSTVYVYNPTQNKYGAWSPTAGSVNGGSANIASGQSFYVKTNGAATLTFKEAYKVANPTVGLFGKSSGAVNNLKIQIGDNTKIYDETIVYMYANASTDFDQNLDAVKPDVANATISTYTSINSTKLIFNAIPELVNGDSATILIHLPLANYTYSYNLSFIGIESFGNTSTQFVLIDNYTSSSTIISPLTTIYSFTTTANNAATYASNRFTLRINTAVGSLPVKLTSFSGSKTGSVSSLKWTTATELNNDRFEIQRSTDGLNYQTIGSVNGASNSYNTINYQFVDETPATGINYYRLNQIDRDGSNKLSNVISINFAKQMEQSTISAWPIPATDFITLELNNTQTVKATITILDMVGKVVFEETIFGEESGYTHPIQVEHFKSGLYYMEVKQENQSTQSIKFIKN